MEATRYRAMCRLIDQVSPRGREKGQTFSDRTIVKIYLYSVLRDRPVSFVCVAENWDQQLLRELIGPLPSQPTMSVRMRTLGVRAILERALLKLGETGGNSLLKLIDSKPLRVGNYSHDRDARRGRAAGEMARGYKLSVIAQGRQMTHWTLGSMNVNDQVLAAGLIPRLEGGGYLAADNGFDSNPTHQLASQYNHQLIAPPRKSNRHVHDARRNCRSRLRSLEALNDLLHREEESFGQSLLRERKQIERNFGHAVMCGMHAPPPWVRTPKRVATWTAGKMIQSMLRLEEIHGVEERL